MRARMRSLGALAWLLVLSSAAASCVQVLGGFKYAATGGASTTTATATGAGGAGGSMTCDACAPTGTLCATAACAEGACVTTNASAGASCMDHGGEHCDGNGACVACVTAGDCTPSPTVCATVTCTGNVCGSTPAMKGTACHDSGGVVCDGLGTCVATHCTDGVKDSGETDVDCGGGTCAPCADTKGCDVSTDCVSGVCTNLVCVACTADAQCASGKWCDPSTDGGTCTPTQPIASACTAGDQCVSGSCVESICCDDACGGICQACTNALTGVAEGTCATALAGTACTSGGGHVCNAGGSCVGCNTSADCSGGALCCGTTCLDVATDPANCGACGNSCPGTTCSGGVCAPVVLASGPTVIDASEIAVDSTNVYWTDYSAGTVGKVPIGGGTPVTLASGQATAKGIAIDSTSVYWTNSGSASSSTGTVNKVSLGGGTVVTLASGQAYPYGIAVDSVSVYWTNPNSQTTMKVPLGGGTAVQLASAGAYSIAVDSTSVFLVEHPSAVLTFPLGGGTPTTLASAIGAVYLAIDTTSVYWMNAAGAGTVVMKVPLSGGTAVQLASSPGAPEAIAVDSTSVYWSSMAGTVMKVPLAGGTAVTLASNLTPYGIAVDATSVYVAAGGSILKVPK